MDLTVMHINKGNAHGTQGERSNPDNSAEHRLLMYNIIAFDEVERKPNFVA